MKKSIFLLTFFICISVVSAFAQKQFTKFEFSGYTVHVIPAKTFAVVTKNNIKANRSTKKGVLEMTIVDQTGSMPKDDVYVFTDRIEYLYLHNSILVMDEALKCDSLEVDLAASFGELNIDGDYLLINAGGGSDFTLKGKVDYLECEVGGGSSLSAAELEAKEADVDVMGCGSAVINAGKINNKRVENGSFKNVFNQ